MVTFDLIVVVVGIVGPVVVLIGLVVVPAVVVVPLLVLDDVGTGVVVLGAK